MLTTLEFNVSLSHVVFYNAGAINFATVPMDLDVKMKAVMLGACFLIVSILWVLTIGK